jgi:hypothetical protein
MKTINLILAGLLFIVLSVQGFAQKKSSNFDTNYYTALGLTKALNYKSGSVKAKAYEIMDKYPGNFNVMQVSAAFDFLYTNWNYIPDPGYEYFEDANSVIESLDGDCDDYAIGMVSLIQALGGEARIVCVSGHAYPEVLLGRNLSSADISNTITNINLYLKEKYGYEQLVGSINYHIDKDGTYWMNLDYQMDYPGGQFHEYATDAEHLVVYSDGSFRISYLNRESKDYLALNKTSL